MWHWHLVLVGEDVTDLQILGCEFHQNEWQPSSAQTCWVAIVLPRSHSCYKGRGRRKGKGKGWE